MKAVVAAFNQERALVGAFSVIVQPVVEPMDRFTALHRGELERDHHQQRREQSDREDEGQEVSQQTPVRRDLPRQVWTTFSLLEFSTKLLKLLFKF